jgi:hypothetical protein
MGLLTAVGAFVAMKLSVLWAAPVALAVRLSADPGHNQALILGALFVLMMGAVVLLTYVLHPDTWLSMEPFEALMGGATGLVTGWLTALVFFTAVGTWGARDLLYSSALAPEIVELRTYHNIVRSLYGLGETQEQRLQVEEK